MKKTVLLLLLLVLTTITFAQWTPLVSGTQRDLNDVFFIDRQNGWVAADSGLALHTTDGGATWTPVTIGQNHLVSIAFLDADTGYVLPQFSVPYYTYDGGLTWTPENSLNGICYGHRIRFNDRILYMAYEGCFGGSWLYTLDPATKDTTELFQFGPNILNSSYRDIGFTGPTHAIAMGITDDIARTVDGGDTWTIATPIDSTRNWQAVDFISPTEGYAITDDEFAPLYKTLDGGQTWGIDSTWGATFFYPIVNDVDYLSPGYGYVTGIGAQGTQGLIFEMRPSTWGNYVLTDELARSVFMVDDSVGYVVGDSGMILKREGGPLAVEQAVQAMDFQVFPNPSTGKITLQWAGQGLAHLQVFAADGRQLLEQALSNGFQEVSMAKLPAGVYVLRLSIDGAVASKRLVLAR